MSWSLDTRILSVLGATLAFVPSGALGGWRMQNPSCAVPFNSSHSLLRHIWGSPSCSKLAVTRPRRRSSIEDTSLAPIAAIHASRWRARAWRYWHPDEFVTGFPPPLLILWLHLRSI